MAKKKNKKRDFGGMVYSTDPDYSYGDDGGGSQNTLPPQQQNLRIHLMRHKGNKMASVVRGFVGSEDDMKDLGKLLKSRCGVGGSVKDGEIIIQGDKRSQMGEILKKEGYKFKLSGG